MKVFKLKSVLGLLAAGMLMSCADLSVENLNNPDTQRALSSSTDLTNVASGLFRSYYVDTYDTSSPAHLMATSADAATCSWGNYGMRDISSEPRGAWDNASNYTYNYVTNNFFNDMYSNLSSASDILAAINNGAVDFGNDVPMMRAWAKFNQGLSLMNLALTFDQAYVITENTDPETLINPTLVPYTEVADSAVALFNQAISIADANTFSIPEGWLNGVTADNVLLSKLANTYAARTMSYLPRTAAEKSSVDWGAVRDHALAGVDADFSVLMDDITWLNDYKWVIAYPGWGRIDMRVINMMDDSYPAYNADGSDYSEPDSARVVDNADVDDRLLTDFAHLSSNNFRPERGLYHFSSFRLSRYQDYITTWDTYLPEILKAENDMLLAEAYIELNNLPGALAILNDPNNSRMDRGGLPAVATEAEARDAVHHERMVELINTSYGLEFFEMRKNDLLQAGTLLQLPLPAKVLELLGYEKPYYTFGGSNPSSSAGGWR